MARIAKIVLRNGTTVPSGADFDVGEPAWDKTAGNLYVKNAAGTMVQIGGTASVPSGIVQLDALGLGTAVASGWELMVNGGTCQQRQSVTAAGSVYTLNVQEANELVTAEAISGAVTVIPSNLNTIPSGYVWRGVFSFEFSGGSIAWSASGYTVKWDDGAPLVPTVGQLETVVITVVGGSTTIEISPLKGRP